MGRKVIIEEFITKCHEQHNHKYDYSKVKYNKLKDKVCIICPIHGEFWQKPQKHLSGQGCPICAIGKTVLANKLGCELRNKYNHLNMSSEYHNKAIFGLKSIDYYIHDYDIAIEYQGRQHFYPVKKFDGEVGFQRQRKLDEDKFQECNDNNIKLFYFTYTKRDVPSSYLDKVYTDFSELCEAIDNYIASKKI